MFLTIGLALSLFKISLAISGVIWNNSSGNFVSLLSIPAFSAAKEKFVRKVRDLEYHNFHKAVLKAAYYEESNLVTFIDNGTKITGVCGDLWTMLADYLNFTLVPIEMKNRNFGTMLENGSYDGILGFIYRNESQIVPRSGVFGTRMTLLQYTMPIWTVRYHLYIKPEWKHDDAWMFHLFSVRLWYSFFFLLFIMSLAGYVCEKNSISKEPKVKRTTHGLQDHVFYTIAIASSQGCVPPELHNKSRIIYLGTSMFSWVILIAFSSHAIYLMMNKKYVLPFTGLKSLIQKSKYDVVAFSGSMVHDKFEETVTRYYRGIHDFSRVSFAPSAEDIYHKVCFSKKQKYAAFEAEDRHRAIGKNICRLVPTLTSYFETWIASAIKRGFRYKRSFDIGILKMHESGLLDGLKDRWLDWKTDENDELPFQSIDITQTYLIFSILAMGYVSSIVIFMLECALFFFRNKRVVSRDKIIKKERLKMMKSRENRIFFLTK